MSAEDSLAKEVAIRIAGEIVLAKNPGEVMKRWRERFNVSQVQLAKYMGVTPSVVSDYEGGRRKSPGAHLIRRYVEALIAIDKERGSPVISELSRFIAVSDKLKEAILDIKDFRKPITIEDFCRRIDAKLLTCHDLKDQILLGYTVVNSFKVFLEVPAYDYLKLYSTTTQRAAIFTKVSRGRSPIVAIKAMQAGMGGLRPALVVLHGLKEVDPLALKVAERERIPVAVTRIEDINELIKRLRELASELV